MKKVVLKDIAQHVGVSTALVSYVLNGQAEEKQVSKENAEKIKLAAIELNYQPNQVAKSLRMRKTHTIGLVVADINYRFSTGITRAIEAEAKRLNFTVIFGSTNESPDKFTELTNVLVNRQVDGLILVPGENSQQQILHLQNSGIPFVLIDRYFPEIDTNYVALDNYKAAYDAVTYLVTSGHKRVSFINLKTSMFHLQERDRGYLDALKDHHLESRPEWLIHIDGDDLPHGIASAIQPLLNSADKPDAIFLATDRLTIEALKRLNTLGVKVPDDISVLSFDESDAFDLFYCPVTHGRQPLEEMGEAAVKTLINLINNQKINKKLTFQAGFVPGKSCRET
ncbi:transcriptional regulator, LacI family [Mucilaginibacter gossypiicola]|uniref:Transcriptional regulator, LacI family n=1 Tax=Mucilaginibacter gossypiicola TaxID=551995 RepID=A0A1H8KUH1_9SPHI|nr:substrate-binding domain-containing protein [Mucilaginibacter gossypiicola]SEN96544.1 transcriptional regulator, LacI family [Mucilaginibacter gossypiicola]